MASINSKRTQLNQHLINLKLFLATSSIRVISSSIILNIRNCTNYVLNGNKGQMFLTL